MKKKTLVIIAVVLLVLMLIPIPIPIMRGYVIWQAVLYQVTDVHRLNPDFTDTPDCDVEPYIEGIKISILGFEVYNSVEK